MIIWVVFLISLVYFSLHFLSLTSSVVIEKRPFSGRKIVYRIVNGCRSTLEKEQSLFSKRARSLWGKEMKPWPTFRITYPRDQSYGLFGFVVPQSFQIENDCLNELGFEIGELNEITECDTIELPLRCHWSAKLNQFRAESALKSMIRLSPFAEFRDWHQKRATYIIPSSNYKGLWNH